MDKANPWHLYRTRDGWENASNKITEGIETILETAVRCRRAGMLRILVSREALDSADILLANWSEYGAEDTESSNAVYLQIDQFLNALG